MKNNLHEVRSDLNSLAKDDFDASNEYLIEIIKTNLLIATIVFALIGAFLGTDYRSDLCLSVLVFFIFLCFTAGLFCGVAQFIIEHQHSKRWGLIRQQLANEIADGEITNEEDFYTRHFTLFDETKISSESSNLMVFLQICFIEKGFEIIFIFLTFLIFVSPCSLAC